MLHVVESNRKNENKISKKYLRKYGIEAKEGLVVDKEISGASSNQLSFPSLSPTSSPSTSR